MTRYDSEDSLEKNLRQQERRFAEVLDASTEIDGRRHE